MGWTGGAWKWPISPVGGSRRVRAPVTTKSIHTNPPINLCKPINPSRQSDQKTKPKPFAGRAGLKSMSKHNSSHPPWKLPPCPWPRRERAPRPPPALGAEGPSPPHPPSPSTPSPPSQPVLLSAHNKTNHKHKAPIIPFRFQRYLP